MPALGDREWVPGVGRCATRVSPGFFPQFQLSCLAPGTPPCFAWFVAGHENEPCGSDYAPWFGRIDGDSMSRFGSSFTLADSVNQSQLKNARILFRVYEPEAHFARHVVIPDIRLSDWTAR